MNPELRSTDAGRIRIDYDRALNPQQREVVFAGKGPILVIAGAGSGKTRTLVYRVARLIESGVSPSSILLLTFTNKAAREMLRRVERLISADIRSLVGGTFHHVGNLFLRRHADHVGFPPGFTILDRDDAASLLNEIASRRKAEPEEGKRPRAEVLIEIFSYASNTGTDLRRVISERNLALLGFTEEILRLRRRYEERKRELHLMDFDDLLIRWRDVLQSHPDVLESMRGRFPHILVDEYQDTNRLQADLVETIAGPSGNLMVVGDDAQSIYSFRGADFGNIIDFPDRFPGCATYKLETNYRSTPQILTLANSSIRNNPRQFRKTLQSLRPDGAIPESIACGDPLEQAAFVARTILELRDEGTDFGGTALLYRAHWHSMELQMELTRRGIPFLVRSGLRFFEQAHVKDVVSYLRIVSNPRDELSWLRILKLYPRIGKATAARIGDALRSCGDPLGELESEPVLRAVPGAARKGWTELVALVRDLREPALRAAPSEMIRRIVEGGYESHLATQYPNASLRLEDLRRFADFALRYADLDAFLSELALGSGGTVEDAAEGAEETDAVVLTTVHQAKGLEWDAVFVVWASEGKFPDARAVREPGGEEEERRLFYVAATRAKDRLFFVHPTIADERGLRSVIQRPSRFLQELDPSTYEERTIAESSGSLPF